VSLEKIKDYEGQVVVDVNHEITEDLAGAIQAAGIERVKIRSVLTCESKRGVCVMCYGRNLASGRLVELGEATGVIAAQSIGEPGTQLTMRTFHIGGTASRVSEQSRLDAKSNGTVRFINLQTVKSKTGDLVVMNRQGSIAIVDEKGRERERYAVVYGAKVKVTEGGPVALGEALVEWDPYTFAILTEIGGTAQFKDLQEGITLHEEVDEVTGLSRHVVADSPDEKRQPAIVIKGKASKRYLMPSRAHLMVQDGDTVFPGDVLAKIPRETTKTKDITGGLPRVVELFEARKPRDTAVISEIDGVVRFGEVAKGQRKLYVAADNGTEKEYSVPRGVHINVQEGERVKAGEPLMDGPLNPHDILAVLGEKELQSYLVNEIQEVYRLQGVNISDKHIEVIVRQMMRWVKVEDVGDTQFLLEQQTDKFRFHEENERCNREWRQTGHWTPVAARYHQGVALDRFVYLGCLLPGDNACADRSFHQGAVDHLRGLKENVIVGRLIPAGTGMEYYRNVRLSPEMEEAASKVQEEVSQAYEDAERALELMRHEGETEELAAE
jgi:DNA-directed RNA polymerase subunit beta'